jgi:transcriptional regulator with XRE-family HTH domain
VDTKILGGRIRDARERLALSQEDLAALVAKDQGAISEYESGKRRLAANDLPIFSRALNVPLLYFFQGELRETDLDRLLLQEFNQLPTPEVKQAAIDIVRVLVNLSKIQSK